jgi:hypothetical protein
MSPPTTKEKKMAALTEVSNAKILKEIVAYSLNINRSIMPGTVDAHYNINMAYGPVEFYVDDAGNKTKLLSFGGNAGPNGEVKNITMTAQKVGEMFMKPVTVDGVATTLGELLADMMDAEIRIALNLPPV